MGKAVFDDDPANGMLLMEGNASAWSGRTSANRITYMIFLTPEGKMVLNINLCSPKHCFLNSYAQNYNNFPNHMQEI